MKWERSDFAVGAVVLLASVMLMGSFLWLSPAISTQAYPLYTEFDRIDGIAKQANVVLRGYNVGRVAEIEPRMDREEGLRFRVRLSIHARLASGDSLLLPEGTVARLIPPPVIGAGYILLEPPPATAPPLSPGSVIRGVRTEPIVEQVQGLTENLSGEVLATMLTARTLMDSVTVAMGQTNAALARTTDALPALLMGLEQQLAATHALTTRLHDELGAVTPTATAAMDTASLLMSDSRRLVQELHHTVQTTTPEIHEILAQLDTTTILFTHFIREVSERPWRVLTGVRPPPGLGARPPAPREPDTLSAGDAETDPPPEP